MTNTTDLCHPDARDHRRVATDGWPAGEVVTESNSGAKQNRRELQALQTADGGPLDRFRVERPNGR
jgi:hypothetical protein